MMMGCGTQGARAAGGPAYHIPVLLQDVLTILSPVDGGIYIDGTFGAGGYSKAILDLAHCSVLAIDQDQNAIKAGQPLAEEYGGRLMLRQGRFGDMETIAHDAGLSEADGIALDIGVSSMQLDEADRGFSFSHDGPLDMRMSQDGPTAGDILNGYEESALANIIYYLGEERKSRAIARAIVRRRQEKPFERTGELADLCSDVLGKSPSQKKHPATRTFQALRLYVNDELDQLVKGLFAAEKLLKAGGRLAVVTFHSLEDRIVKKFFTERSGKITRPSRHLPDLELEARAPSFELLSRRPITPDKKEIELNPRARSAHLRVGERTDAPPYPSDVKNLGLPNLLRVG